MLRDKSLVPLSHQHQHALALCVRLERAPKAAPDELSEWNQEVDHIFLTEIRFHFDAEEQLLFPAAMPYPEMAPLINDLLAEHRTLRGYFGRASRGELDAVQLAEFASTLSGHVRKEERQLFEDCQRLMSAEEMSRVGALLDEYFRTMPGASCALRDQ